MKKLFTLLFLLTAFTSNAQNNLNKITGLESTAASVAYSLRQLSTSYTGPLVRIKVGSSFYDVYPDVSTTKFSLNSKISAAIGTYTAAAAVASANALSTIISGSTDATVAIWYDQSGNAVNVLSSTSSPGAKIITAGSINNIFGQPTIYFSGSNSSLGSSSTVDYSALSGATVNAVAQNVATTSGYAGIIGTADAGTYPGYNISYSSPSSGYGSDGDGCFYRTSVTSTDIKVVTNIFINNTKNLSKIYVNGELKTNVAVTSGTCNLTHSSGSKIFIGVSRGFGKPSAFIGNISEAIIIPSQLSDEVRNPLETNQTQTYYGPSVTITSSASGAVCAGTSVTFTATTYNFSGTTTYQWYKNSVAINGETSASYITSTLANADQIYVIASAVTSNSLNANITAGPSAVVTVSGDGCINKTTLSTPAGQSAYAWYKDDVAISNTNSTTYSPTTAGEYKVQVTSGTCSTMSAITTISVCGVTGDGKMMSLAFAAPLVSTDGGANVGTGIDEQGKIHNTTGITTTKGTIGETTAIIGGVIGSTNGKSSSVGVIYSTDSNFGTYSTATIQTNVSAGTYTSTISGLSSSTTYYAKAFIVNKAGTSYGAVISFATVTVVPTQVALTRASVGTAYGTAFTTQPQVTIQDVSGSTVTSSSAVVTATISAGGALVGTTTATASSGVATFSNLGIKGAATAYTITYTVSGLTPATQSVTPTALSIGSTGPGGGKVFYAATSGFACGPTLSETCFYLEVAPSSAQAGRDWAQSGFTGITVPNGATGTAIGTGYKNTVAIIAQGNNNPANSAAAYAQAYRGGSLTDWYMPSTLELKELATKYSSFSSDATFTGAPAVLWEWWTSTEFSSSRAYTVRISDNGGPWDNTKGSNPNPVRPIRSF
jgi:hypothetical protein